MSAARAAFTSQLVNGRAPNNEKAVKCDVLEPCGCGAPAIRRLFAVTYCQVCLDDVLDPIRERLRARNVLQGWGCRYGRERPDIGPALADLKCVSPDCSATWVGRHGESCRWCERRLEVLRHHQAQLVLSAELPDADDARRDGAVRAWGGRLARAVEVELISEHEAMTAWRKVVGDDFRAA